jgi:hypothetical protein
MVPVVGVAATQETLLLFVDCVTIVALTAFKGRRRKRQ